jgi:hypothetical protein
MAITVGVMLAVDYFTETDFTANEIFFWSFGCGLWARFEKKLEYCDEMIANLKAMTVKEE